MDHIRLIASDMDATLLNERSQLPPDFAETIRALAGQGILFAAASGRPLYTLETMFPELLEEIILIGDNGGAARWKGKDLFVSEMPAEGWRQLARSTKQAGDVGLLCGLQAAYAEKRDERYDAVFKNFYTHQTRKIRTYFRLEKGSDFSFSLGTAMKAPVDGAKLRYLVIDRKTITRFGGYDYEVR